MQISTSDFKRGPGQRLLTLITRELALDGPARILYVFGFRAEESTGRAKKLPCAVNTAASNLTKRHVTDWYPVHHWTVGQVWDEIGSSGRQRAWPYDAGKACPAPCASSRPNKTSSPRSGFGLAWPAVTPPWKPAPVTRSSGPAPWRR